MVGRVRRGLVMVGRGRVAVGVRGRGAVHVVVALVTVTAVDVPAMVSRPVRPVMVDQDVVLDIRPRRLRAVPSDVATRDTRAEVKSHLAVVIDTLVPFLDDRRLRGEDATRGDSRVREAQREERGT